MEIRKQDALDYHRLGRKGKIEVVPSKPCRTQWDLSLAYTPGVAEPCLEIHEKPELGFEYTARGNLVAVISNGTAVLGLGNIGPLAGKPVMEGKGVLFKRFADIDVFDLEVNSEEVIRLCQLLEPTFGGINLEDIKAPECFYIEQTLRKTMSIPVFHDDQHGTAIISGAALLNALEVVGKDISKVRVVFNGAGAVEDHADFADVFAHHLQGVQQRRAGNDGRPMLIVVKHRNRHRLAQGLFNIKALRRFDVLQIDAAESRLKKLAKANDLVGILGIHFQVEDVDVREALEQHPLAFHNRLAGQRSNVAETQDRGAVGDHRHQVPASGVFESQLGLFVNFQARLRHAWGIGQTQIPLRAARLGGNNLDLALAPEAVVIKRVLFANFHGIAPLVNPSFVPALVVQHRGAGFNLVALRVVGRFYVETALHRHWAR